MKLNFLNEKYINELPEITTSKIILKKNFHPEGLFSQQIFGPTKSFTCECRFRSSSLIGSKCKECGIDIVDSKVRRTRFAKIVLPFKIVNPLMYSLISKIKKLKENVDFFINNDNSILYLKNDEIILSEGINKKYEEWDSYEETDAIKEIVKLYCLSKIEIKKWSWLYDNIDRILLKNIIVLPPDLRQVSKKESQLILDDINKIYMRILIEKETLQKGIYSNNLDKKIKYQVQKPIQKLSFLLYEFIFSLLSKKEGLIRSNILGKRIDFSGRAVIVPEPLLKLDECSLPYFMVIKILKVQLANYLIENNKTKLLSIASSYIDKCIEQKSFELFDYLEEIVEGEYCILNRQPSLTRLSMQGFKIKLNRENVIKIHPLVCSCFNADFDGDLMAVYIPITEESKKEIKEKFLVEKNLFNPANGKLSTIPSQDIILGIYLLTSGQFKNGKIIKYKNKKVPEYIKIFNDCLPKDYELVEDIIDQKKLLEILENIKNTYSSNITKNTLDNIKEIGFEYCTEYGCTMSLDKFNVKNIKEIKDKIFCEDIQESLKNIQSSEILDLVKKSFQYSHIIDSGARGNWSQAKQIILARGFVSNFEGEIIKTPIKSNLIEGLTPNEFFTSTYGSRKGLLDVAINTGISGYLSRKLIFTCINMKQSDCADCGTKDTLNVYVSSVKKAKMLISKYYIDNGELKKITKDNFKDLVGKEINLRSQIFCKNQEVCETCFGDYPFMNTPYVGVVAAQSLGEVSTQLVLRTFHNSGIASSKSSDMKQDDIVADLSTVIHILQKVKNSNCERMISDLFEIYNKSGDILHTHFESLVAQMMWQNSRKWRLQENRNVKDVEYLSVVKVPSEESWILGLAFSSVKFHVVKGLIENKASSYESIIDSILMGKKL